MRKLLFLPLWMLVATIAFAQTPVNMAGQPGLTYTEDFADLANWTFSAAADGSFSAGTGAAAWKGNAAGGSGTIPAATKLTVASTSFQTDIYGSTAGLYKNGQSLMLLSTGTADNTSSVAIDLFLNFSGLTAGTLSFDWASVNNSTGSRNASMRVYASVDGAAFTEITGAAVLNFTNNAPTAGTINAVALPGIFNNASTARLRFYYYNGTGGSTGPRPKLSIDNVKVTAVASSACTTPASQPTGFTLGTVAPNSIQATFTAPSPAPDRYLVLMSPNNSLSELPVNGLAYAAGDNIGDATVVTATSLPSFTLSGLSASTTYYFFIFSANVACNGGPLYLSANPLTGSGTTQSGNGPCTAPAAQPTALTFGSLTANSISGSFTASGADEYLVVRTATSNLSTLPVNGTVYSPGNPLGNGTVVGRGPLTNFTAAGLAAGTTYYFHLFAVNSQNCTGGPIYLTPLPLTGQAATSATASCTTPTAQPSGLKLAASNTAITGYFSPVAGVDGYLTLISTSASLSTLPVNGTNYANGAVLGNATVVENKAATSFIATNLVPGTTYYLSVFARNSVCAGGPVYRTVSPLQGSVAAPVSAPLTTYFGNLHAHSSSSDGNKDNLSLKPADDYAYAKSSLCMDFLGISEHNHSGTGMSLSKWAPGLSAAAAATTSSFLALYGMEWGVISNGGHVLVYGVDQLLGWEAGNYNVYIPKSDYLGTPQTTGTTGLFRYVNTWGANAFASLCHPDLSDFDNLAMTAYNATADSALVGSAVASGPPFSTNTTYSDPPSFSHLDYYKTLLAKGYHIGPFVDADNHNTNFGRNNRYRLAVVSPTLAKADFIASMRNRRFYATADCNAKLTFVLNNENMGAIADGSTFPSISVNVVDPTNAAATPLIKILYGVRGSNVLAVTLDSVTSKTFNLTDFNAPLNTEVYYYADVTIGGARIISSPIWYTRTPAATPLPVTWLSFTAAATAEQTVRLSWATANETNNQRYLVERSSDGTRFSSIESIAAKNGVQNRYETLDKKPLPAVNYYRLKQVNYDGSFSYSKLVAVDLRKEAANAFGILQNPVRQELSISLQSNATQPVQLVLTDGNGKVLQTVRKVVQKGVQVFGLPVQTLAAGVYFISAVFNDQKQTIRFFKN